MSGKVFGFQRVDTDLVQTTNVRVLNMRKHGFPAHSSFLLAVAILMLVPVFPADSFAQYFGRNKVQYESFHFKTIQTPHFDIYYYPEEEQVATDAARMAERWYERYSTFLDHRFKERQPVVLYANDADFQQTNVVEGIISQGTGGVTEGLMDRVVLPLTGVYAENDHVLGHELVHAFQFNIMKERSRKLFSTSQLPLWFIEGMAEYLSLGRDYPLTAMWMRDAVLHDDIPSIDKMSSDPRYFPYRWGQALWAYISGTYGSDKVPVMFSSVIVGGVKEGTKKALGVSLDTLSDNWLKSVRDTYGPEIEGKTKPSDIGRPILVSKEKGEGISLSPSLSPDGKYLAILSRQGLFSIDLYLVDAETGKVLNKLVSSSTNAHFDALRFIDASGTWSPDGSQFAFVVYENGNNAIAILDVASRKVERTIKLDEVDGVYQLAWSPDGQSLAISGSSGGLGGLYLYSFKTKKLERLTDERYAALQPAWSPDGKTIAFATDRGPATDFDSLEYGSMQIALYDMDTKEINTVVLAENAKHINPQFSPDGRSIFFLSNPDGISNLYRYDRSEDKFYKITDIATGVSGLTELSPALSVASGNGRIVFTVFDRMNYDVYELDSSQAVGQPYPLAETMAATDAVLAPTDAHGQISDYLSHPAEGLMPSKDFTKEKYHGGLRLAAVGQPTVGVAVDRFGTSLGGGISMLFSDVLGNRELGIAAQANGGVKDLGAQAYYQNRSHRLNWGAVMGHIPYEVAYVNTGTQTTTVNGQEVEAGTIDLIRQRVFIDRAAMITDYPLSTNRRIELSGGFTHVGYSNEVDRLVEYGGVVLDETTESLPALSGLNLVQASAAYVGDYSYFGFTSPIKGSRYRFEAEPTVGTLEYLTVLGDVRDYIFLNPFTFAVRFLHVGRYLRDSESDRLWPYYLGSGTLVRGYGSGSIDVSECAGSDDPTKCPVFDRLVGSRIAVMNIEWRMPLLGTSDFGLINFPYLPTELALFLDGGIAWNAGDHPVFKLASHSNERIPVFSAGVATRMNILGYLVGQVYLAFPFQRPEKTTQLGFLIATGW